MPRRSRVREIGVGVVGLGTVGQAFVEQFHSQARKIEREHGIRLKLVAAAVRDPLKQRKVKIDPAILTTDALSVARHPDVQVLVEVMGGEKPAYEIVSEALRKGKQVVTANKALLVEKGVELAELARKKRVGLFFEASVAGGLPVIRTIRDYSAHQRITSVTGIVNGTTNYMLWRMEQGATYKKALKEAQKLGYAEADPTYDVDGYDAVSKLHILGALAFGRSPRSIFGATYLFTHPMRYVTREDLEFADKHGYAVRYVGHITRVRGNRFTSGVFPTFVRKESPFASVTGPENLVIIEGSRTGPIQIRGAGAGGKATGHAVLADVIEAAKAVHAERRPSVRIFPRREGEMESPENIRGRFYFGVPVEDKPGELRRVAEAFERGGVNISHLDQVLHGDGRAVVRLMTHETTLAKAWDTYKGLLDLRTREMEAEEEENEDAEHIRFFRVEPGKEKSRRSRGRR
jgi:homoserine dehydrogenase